MDTHAHDQDKLLLLAIDTSTRSMSIALHDGDNILAEYTIQTNNQHSTRLAPAIARMLEINQTSVQDLTAMAVSIGPGSYTGLRIGVALAKGLVTVYQLPLIGVSSLDILAAGQPFYNTRYQMLVVVPAGRGRIITGAYRGKKGRWVSNSELKLTDWASLLGDIEDRTYLTGEITKEGLDAIQAAQDSNAPITLVTAGYRLRRAGFLAEEAFLQLWRADAKDFPPALVTPIYMKPPG